METSLYATYYKTLRYVVKRYDQWRAQGVNIWGGGGNIRAVGRVHLGGPGACPRNIWVSEMALFPHSDSTFAHPTGYDTFQGVTLRYVRRYITL